MISIIFLLIFILTESSKPPIYVQVGPVYPSIDDDYKYNTEGMKYSRDGTQLYYVNYRRGLAYVLDGAGNVLSELIVTRPVDDDYYHSGIDDSFDHSILVIGAGNDYVQAGLVLIFTQVVYGEYTQTQILTPTDFYPGNPSYFGVSVSCSFDCSYIAIGGPGDNDNVGATWVFTTNGIISPTTSPSHSPTKIPSSFAPTTNSPTTAHPTTPKPSYSPTSTGPWNQDGPKLVGTGANGNARQGNAVAMSSDGSFFVTAGYGDMPSGAIWVFKNEGPGIWKQFGNKIVPITGNTNIYFGNNIALSRNNRVLAVSAPYDNSDFGSIYVLNSTTLPQFNQSAILTIANHTECPGLYLGWFPFGINGDGTLIASSGYPTVNQDGFSVYWYNSTSSTWINSQCGVRGNLSPSKKSGSWLSMKEDGSTIALINLGGTYQFFNSGLHIRASMNVVLFLLLVIILVL